MSEEGYSLYLMPSFFDGFSRIIDFSGMFDQYNYVKTNDEAEGKAVLSDWIKVGHQLKLAMSDMSRKTTDGEKAK